MINDMRYHAGDKITKDEDGYELGEDAYTLSENQAKFCNNADKCGLDIVQYSGRGMYGKQCPSVHVDEPNDIATRAKVRTDSMGRGVVVYAQY